MINKDRPPFAQSRDVKAERAARGDKAGMSERVLDQARKRKDGDESATKKGGKEEAHTQQGHTSETRTTIGKKHTRPLLAGSPNQKGFRSKGAVRGPSSFSRHVNDASCSSTHTTSPNS